jgi:Fe-Mn family superoxide dismutase
MSARSGYVVTAYNILMKRFMNLVIDGGDCNIPVGSFPVIVLDVSEGAYYRDYVGDRKTYIIAMMKELNWEVIEERVKKADRLAKVMA